jgi:hypothetical protein
VLKVQHKPIKRSKLGFKTKEQKKPKRTLVWRTGQCPVPQGPYRLNSPPSGIWKVALLWFTGLSGVPSEATVASATVDFWKSPRGGVNRAKLKFTKLITTISRVSVRNIIEPARVKGKCALGPFLSVLVIECQHKCLNVNQCPWMNRVQI